MNYKLKRVCFFSGEFQLRFCSSDVCAHMFCNPSKADNEFAVKIEQYHRICYDKISAVLKLMLMTITFSRAASSFVSESEFDV